MNPSSSSFLHSAQINQPLELLFLIISSEDEEIIRNLSELLFSRMVKLSQEKNIPNCYINFNITLKICERKPEGTAAFWHSPEEKQEYDLFAYELEKIFSNYGLPRKGGSQELFLAGNTEALKSVSKIFECYALCKKRWAEASVSQKGPLDHKALIFRVSELLLQKLRAFLFAINLSPKALSEEEFFKKLTQRTRFKTICPLREKKNNAGNEKNSNKERLPGRRLKNPKKEKMQ